MTGLTSLCRCSGIGPTLASMAACQCVLESYQSYRGFRPNVGINYHYEPNSVGNTGGYLGVLAVRGSRGMAERGEL